MKRKLFWVAFPFLAISLLIVAIIATVTQFITDMADGYSNVLNNFESWCLDIIPNNDPDDQNE